LKEFLPLFVELSKSDGYWTVNKLFVKYFKSVEKALFLSELISKQSYFAIKNQLVKGEWFFLTYDKIKESTYISLNKQRKFVKELVNDDIIDVKMMGIPAKQYYRINSNIIVNTLDKIRDALPLKVIKNKESLKKLKTMPYKEYLQTDH